MLSHYGRQSNLMIIMLTEFLIINNTKLLFYHSFVYPCLQKAFTNTLLRSFLLRSLLKTYIIIIYTKICFRPSGLSEQRIGRRLVFRVFCDGSRLRDLKLKKFRRSNTPAKSFPPKTKSSERCRLTPAPSTRSSN